MSLLSEEDNRRYVVMTKPVQEVNLEQFGALQKDDILFIDSSHVVKIGSDVSYLIGEVLPCLNSGVVIHFHDIFWPFEYPQEWVLQGTAWNEAYFLRTFLQYNNLFEIEYFNAYIAAVHRSTLKERMPLCLENSGAGIWIRKVG
jgi:hypothetical protein